MKTKSAAFSNRCVLRLIVMALLLTLLAGCGESSDTQSDDRNANSSQSASAEKDKPLDKVTFTTSWYAQAEHGGYYQAVADGTYEKYGLDVTVDMGGPQVNNLQLLLAGKADFIMGYGVRALKSAGDGLPAVVVGAIFQKDPQALLAHPDIKTLADLKGHPIAVSSYADTTFWPWLQSKYGYTGDQKQPYSFSVAPFINNPELAQQAYVTSEPFAVQQQADFEPTILLFADNGYPPYGNTITTTREMVEENPDVVQRFVTATIVGWQHYLDDPTEGNKHIQQANADMSDEQIAFGIDKMKEYGLITGGDTGNPGIGTMTDERWKQTFDFMTNVGMVPADTDYKQVYTLDFVNKAQEMLGNDEPD
ncbi:ABC transporter substrate-binding protein [Salinisphaera shabanensis]|nr:ABC transporter substrate-binding protein [Salinisphaera shabanensis]